MKNFDYSLYRFSSLHSWYKMRGIIDPNVKVVPVVGNVQEFSYNEDVSPIEYPNEVFWHFCFSGRENWFNKPEGKLETVLEQNKVSVEMSDFYQSYNVHRDLWEVGMSKNDYWNLFHPENENRRYFEKDWVRFEPVYNSLKASAEKTVDFLLESKEAVPVVCFWKNNYVEDL